MVGDDWGERLASIEAALSNIEAQFTDGQAKPAELADFKAAVDNLRFRVWALLSATSLEDHQAFHERLRIRRTLELCQRIRHDLLDGTMTAGHLELPELAEAAQALRAAIVARQQTGR
jgi:hypothetical protein